MPFYHTPLVKIYWGQTPCPAAVVLQLQPVASWPLAERVPCESTKPLLEVRAGFSGISRSRAARWCTQLGVVSEQSWSSLAPVKQQQLQQWRRQHQDLLLDVRFKKAKLDRIARWLSTKHQKAYRLLCGYPLRGQRTRTNRKTARKLSRQWIARLRRLTSASRSKNSSSARRS